MQTEADWKKFKAMAPILRERYLAERNTLFAAMLTAPKKTETERFWDTIEAMNKTAKALRRCLDGHSRSTMQQFMVCMIGDDMLRKSDLEGFSDDFKAVFLEIFADRERNLNQPSS
jgi:hypothetical protein